MIGVIAINNTDILTSQSGYLYNFNAVDTGILAPTGWHVATDTEWAALISALGGSTSAAGPLKETGTIHWNTPNTGATNSSGFTAISTGYRDSNGYSNLGIRGQWWTSNYFGSGLVWGYYVLNSSDDSYRDSILITTGCAVRCIKDVTDGSTTVTDIDGNVYNTVTINGVQWMKSDLKTTRYNDGSFINHILSQHEWNTDMYGAYCIYGEIDTNIPILTTNGVTSIANTTATSGGTIISDNGAAITAKGVCWSTSINPTIANSKTNNGSGNSNFTSSITGLSGDVLYYVRAYATNANGTGYGDQVSFNTPFNAPTITTTAISNIAFETATSGGTISGTGIGTISEKGICWNTSTNPTINNYRLSAGSGTTPYNINLSELNENQIYYVRAYAINQRGITYGNELSFTTLQVTYGDYYKGGTLIAFFNTPNSVSNKFTGILLFDRVFFPDGIRWKPATFPLPPFRDSTPLFLGSGYNNVDFVGWGKEGTRRLIAAYGDFDNPGIAEYIWNQYPTNRNNVTSSYNDWHMPTIGDLTIIKQQKLLNSDYIWQGTSEEGLDPKEHIIASCVGYASNIFDYTDYLSYIWTDPLSISRSVRKDRTDDKVYSTLWIKYFDTFRTPV